MNLVGGSCLLFVIAFHESASAFVTPNHRRCHRSNRYNHDAILMNGKKKLQQSATTINDDDTKTSTPTPTTNGDVQSVFEGSSSPALFPSPPVVEFDDGDQTASGLDFMGMSEEIEIDDEESKPEQLLIDEKYMKVAIDYALEVGGERGPESAYPNPTTGAVLVADDGRILGQGRSSYAKHAILDVLNDAGLDITALREWCITWPSSAELRKDLSTATLYLTLEPSHRRRGQATPPLTQLIELSGIPRVVVGCPSPIPEETTQGAQTLHQAGLDVDVGVLAEECRELIKLYEERANSKLQRMARKHSKMFGRPLGFLHCSVVDSVDLEAFAQHGNAFGKAFGGKTLSFRDFGSYEIAPPPESIWALDDDNDDDMSRQPDGLDVGYVEIDMDDDDSNIQEDDNMYSLDFEEESAQERLDRSPVMPW